MENCIVVLPYKETSRFFHASKTTNQEAFIGDNGSIVYYQSQAKRFTAKEANVLAVNSLNTQVFVREVSK